MNARAKLAVPEPPNKNEKLLAEFIEHCTTHPEERFWQALRSWSGWDAVYVAKNSETKVLKMDTFYWTKKGGM